MYIGQYLEPYTFIRMNVQNLFVIYICDSQRPKVAKVFKGGNEARVNMRESIGNLIHLVCMLTLPHCPHN